MSTEKISILLAEDDKNLGNLLREYLEAKGHNVRLAVYGNESYDFFSNDSSHTSANVLKFH